uniref:E3 UFM1-protein ligase 1 homolog n=1 Tax=Xenopsylla cheopis TaxID=163159 RepID=A0A6M2DJF8_XENCH
MSEWDEIKRLAEDLQRVQLKSSVQKLSEQNCIEIVNLLIQNKSIELLFTDDGKEYLTPQQLTSEIKDELYMRGGRANIVDIAKTLNVDLNQVTHKVNELVRSSKELDFVLGQLIDSTYRKKIAYDINVKLRNFGQVFLADLSLQYDLPTEYLLNNIVEKELGKTIEGEQDAKDPRILQTQVYIAKCKAKLRGAITALFSPTPVSTILSLCNISDQILYSSLDQPWFCGTLTSKLPGGLFVPNSYSKAQTEWVTDFLKQNNYLEYESLNRWGIPDPKSYIERTYNEQTFMFLKSCALGSMYISMLEESVDECISSKSYIDMATILPSVISSTELEDCLKQILKTKDKNLILFDTIVFSTFYIEGLANPCKTEAETRAKSYVENGHYQKYIAEKQLAMKKSDSNADFVDVKSEKREERRKKAAGGKTGGGTQGRETKTKSTKKHIRTKKGQNDSDDEINDSISANPDVPELLSLNDIEEIINSTLKEEGLDDLASNIAEHLHPSINKHALDFAQTFYDSKMHTSISNRRQNHIALQDKLNNMINDVRLYDKGIKIFDAEVQIQLKKYLLKSLCNDITNLLTNYFAQESGLQDFDSNITTQQRSKIVQELSDDFKSVLSKNIATLSGSSIEDFLDTAEACLSVAGITLKKIDKKKDRTIILCHKHGLLEQLANSSDPAVVLHLTCLCLHTIATQTMLHASGKFISDIVKLLQPHLPVDIYKKITDYQLLVMKYLNTGAESEEHKEILSQLLTGIEEIKDIAAKFKKQSQNQED